MNNLTGEVKLSGKSIGDVTIATTNADGSMRSLTAILADCRSAFGQLSDSEKASNAEALVGKNAMSGFLALMNSAQLQQNIAKIIRNAQQNTADGIDEKLQSLQKELLKKANSKEAYDEIADEIFKLREQREKCTVDTAARDTQIARINELQDFIKQQPAHLDAFDEALVKRWLERIIIWDDHFTVELKFGLKIDIEG